jgi:hypothetical protein
VGLHKLNREPRLRHTRLIHRSRFAAQVSLMELSTLAPRRRVLPSLSGVCLCACNIQLQCLEGMKLHLCFWCRTTIINLPRSGQPLMSCCALRLQVPFLSGAGRSW